MKILFTAISLLFLCAAAVYASPRYISLAPSTTEILFALGLDEEIIAVSSNCNYPDRAKNKQKIGDFSHPNIEKIFSLKPDYIFCTGLEQVPIIQELKRLNLNIYISDPANMEELLKSITEIGVITKKTKEAENLVTKMKNDIETIQAHVKLIPSDKKLKVFIEIWHDPLMTAGKGTFIDELVTLAGGINVAHDTLRPYSNYSPEIVVSSDPDCIISTVMGKDSSLQLLENRLGWSGIKAVRNKRVYTDINPDILLRPGPRTTEGLKELYKRLYS